MSRGALLATVALLSTLLLPGRTAARDLSVEASACPELDTAALGDAIALETGGRWTVVQSGPAPVRVDVARCDATGWTLQVLDSQRRLLLGPIRVAMEGLSAETRVRVAALWTAEWLATLDDEAQLTSSLDSPVPPEVAEPGDVVGTSPRVELAVPRPAVDRLRVRAAALAAWHHAADLWGNLGGGDLGLSAAFVSAGGFGFGVEAAFGFDYGLQLGLFPLSLAHGFGSLFGVATVDWLELNAGFRTTVEGILTLERTDTNAVLDSHAIARFGGFLRAMFRVAPEVSVTGDLEVAGAPDGISYSYDEIRRFSTRRRGWQLLRGLHVTTRVGVVIELLP